MIQESIVNPMLRTGTGRFFSLFFCLAAIMVSSEGYSQKYFFRKYSVEEGMPTSSVYSLLQDSRGYIWMGTVGGGVILFDGVNYTTFTTDNGLTDNIVRSLFEDSRGNIWMGTDDGITIYDGKSFRQVKKAGGLAGSAVLKFTETRGGMILAGTNDGGLAAITAGDSLRIQNFTMNEGLNSNFVYDIFEAPDGKLWLGMIGGINILETGGGDSLIINKVTDPMVPSDFVLSVARLASGIFLAGTRENGLFMLIPRQNGYDVIPSAINKDYPGMTVWDILVKDDGEAWLATDTYGVIRLKEDKVTGILGKSQGFPTDRVMNIIADNEGNTWFATLDQGAVMFRDETITTYNEAEGIPGNEVLGIMFTDNELYVGSDEGVAAFRVDGEKIARTALFSGESGPAGKRATALAAYKGNIWVGSGRGLYIMKGKALIAFPVNFQLPDQNINSLLSDTRGNLWIGTRGGFSRYNGRQLFSMTQDDGLIHNEVQTIFEDSKGTVWMGTVGGLTRVNDTVTITNFSAEDGLSFPWINALAEDSNGDIWIGTFGGGIFKFDIKADTLPVSRVAAVGLISSNNINSLCFINDTSLVAGTDKGFDLIKLDAGRNISGVVRFGLDDGFAGGENNANSIASDGRGNIWLGTRNGLVKYDPSASKTSLKPPSVLFSGLKLSFREVDWASRNVSTEGWTGMPASLVLSYRENQLFFNVTGFSYENPGNLMFSWFLEPQSKEWSPYSHERVIPFPGLPPGNYTLKVRAVNKYGVPGKPSEFSFVIRPPFYKTKGFVIFSVLTLLFIILTFFRLRERKLILEKIKLENVVKERTREVVEQKDEIARQRDVVTSQKKEITDSINYAERIQNAVMPDDSVLGKVFSEYFIILRPKDIVSGDFYWMTLKDGTAVFAAADCTGHGVPGAFMSMLGVSFLNKIVNESGITDPSRILSLLRENIIAALKQRGSAVESKDGMDMALCSVDVSSGKLLFSGANNPLYVVRTENGSSDCIELKGDMMPVGVYTRMNDFTCLETSVRKNDSLYLFSDGFIDQFGGPEGRKFMKKRFRQMLIDHQHLSMHDQKEAFCRILDEWISYPCENKVHTGQIDDILLMGIRV